MRLSEGQVIAGRYEINFILGSGGMAVVYRALDTKLDRYVTLKILREELAENEEFVRRFPIEAMAAAALSHPNIVSIYDYGQDGEIYYIVLEYIDGSNLKDLINHHAPFSNEATLGMALQVADGLAAAHRAGIVHRDIKPQNILVTASSNAKVADFGIARVAKSGTIATGESMGSVQYFSPEQARGGYVDHKADIYSLGIVMFEMITGRLPYDGDNPVAIAMQHINEPIPDIVALNPDVSESVIRIILKATDKSTAKRYQTIEEMAEDLNQALTDASGTFVRSETMPLDYNAIYGDSYNDGYYGDNTYDQNDPPQTAPISPEEKKANRTAILVGVGLGLVFAVLILILSVSIFNRLRTVRISPPYVIGMTYDEATIAAQEAGLNIAVEFIFHNEVPEGRIIYQSPTPEHANMAPGNNIHVTISRGPSQYIMPDVVGMHIDEAREMLSDLYDNILLIEREDEAEPGIVFLQEPDPGTHIGEDTPVFLYVSLGMEEEEPENDYVQVPHLIGLSQEDALALLEEAGLTVGIILQDESTTFASGMIFRQSPGSGDIVERGSLVGFSVSTGSPLPPTPAPTPEPDYDDDPNELPENYVLMPNLMGRTQEDAMALLRDAELIAGVILNEESTTFEAGIIFMQDPMPGEVIEQGSFVSFTISTGSTQYQPEPTPYPDYDDPNGDDYPPEPTPIPISRTLSIELWEVDAESVHIRVTRQPVGGSLSTVANSPVAADSFPLDMHIEGNGVVVYRVYHIVDGQAHFIRDYIIDFDD